MLMLKYTDFQLSEHVSSWNIVTYCCYFHGEIFGFYGIKLPWSGLGSLIETGGLFFFQCIWTGGLLQAGAN